MAKALSAKTNVFKKGAWSEDEDHKLRTYIQRYGHWNWGLLPKFAGASHLVSFLSSCIVANRCEVLILINLSIVFFRFVEKWEEL